MKRLTRVYIEGIADRILKAYMNLPEIKGAEIYRIDPELLLTRVLGLKIEYAHLSLDGTVLGMTSFGEVEVEVYDEADGEYFLCLDGKTVVIDRGLIADTTKKGRCNFTTLHEGAHQAFNMLFPKEYGVGAKAAELHFYTANSECKKPISDWEEWQANTLAGALLLPEDLVKKGMFLFGLSDKIKILNKIYSRETYDKFAALADFLGSSKKALAIRMKQLKLLEQDYLDNPFSMLEVVKEA